VGSRAAATTSTLFCDRSLIRGVTKARSGRQEESETEQFGKGDIGILNYALTLEYLETAFYEEAKTKVKASGELKSLLSLLASDEKQHVEALEGTIVKLGGKPVAKPTFNFEYSVTSGFLKLAETSENVGVGAYNGAAPGSSRKKS
jgi:rubrerythrin